MKTEPATLFRWIKKRRKWWLPGLVSMLLLTIAIIVSSNLLCERTTEGRIFRSPEALPKCDVGLVLGTSKLTKRGNPNLHFNTRIETAAALYRAGKVRHLLVSGDNHVVGYDEPSDMRDALVAAGVPAEAITCDYAGFRTLDSVVRANTVFGLTHFTIITEAFHCPRAVWIARQHGLDAVAFAAPDVAKPGWSLRVKLREYAARAWCAVDLYVLHRNPKFIGPKEPIFLASAEK